jgi:hypothetical protein
MNENRASHDYVLIKRTRDAPFWLRMLAVASIFPALCENLQRRIFRECDGNQVFSDRSREDRVRIRLACALSPSLERLRWTCRATGSRSGTEAYANLRQPALHSASSRPCTSVSVQWSRSRLWRPRRHGYRHSRPGGTLIVCPVAAHGVLIPGVIRP